MKEKYEKYKNEYLNSVILIKSGNFYATINDDALIMKSLFNYQIIKDKIGFPLNSIEKVKDRLNEYKVNYIIINSEEEINKKDFESNNNYLQILNNYKKQEYKDKMKKLLFDRIEYLISIDNDNFEKIRKFIDEL